MHFRKSLKYAKRKHKWLFQKVFGPIVLREGGKLEVDISTTYLLRVGGSGQCWKQLKPLYQEVRSSFMHVALLLINQHLKTVQRFFLHLLRSLTFTSFVTLSMQKNLFFSSENSLHFQNIFTKQSIGKLLILYKQTFLHTFATFLMRK